MKPERLLKRRKLSKKIRDALQPHKYENQSEATANTWGIKFVILAGENQIPSKIQKLQKRELIENKQIAYLLEKQKHDW